MNNLNTAAGQEKRIPAKVNQLRSQNNQINGEITKDIHSVIERVRNIGLRLNYQDHPDNIPQELAKLSSGDKYSEESTKPQVDGLEGELVSVIEQGSGFINDWHNTLYRHIDKYLTYIEQYV